MLQRILALILALAALGLPAQSLAEDRPGNFLFVWAGDPAKEARQLEQTASDLPRDA